MLIREELKTTKFSKTDESIAQYFINIGSTLKTKTVRDVAKETYCSPSTIMRFTQRLGFAGFNEFKEMYLEEENYLQSHFQDVDANVPFEKNDQPMAIASKLGTLYQEIIEDNKSLVSHDSLLQAIKLLKKFKSVSIVASSSQVGMAYSFKDKCAKIGKKVMIHFHSDEAYYDACFSNDTCFILISYSGETSRCLKVAQKLYERHIPFIAITSFGANSLSKLTPCCLCVSTREKLVDNLGAFAMNVSTLYLLDTLYACYFSGNFEENKQQKVTVSKEYETAVEYLGRQSDNPILK